MVFCITDYSAILKPSYTLFVCIFASKVFDVYAVER